MTYITWFSSLLVKRLLVMMHCFWQFYLIMFYHLKLLYSVLNTLGLSFGVHDVCLKKFPSVKCSRFCSCLCLHNFERIYWIRESGPCCRGSLLAEFLTDGDPHGPLKKSVEELEKHDPKALEYCSRLASHYSKQLFEIYKNKEDPYFLPCWTGLIQSISVLLQGFGVWVKWADAWRISTERGDFAVQMYICYCIGLN